MNTERIKEIQQATAYPESVSVQQALLQVWNETEQEQLGIPAVSSRFYDYDKRGVRAFVRYATSSGGWAIECYRKKRKDESKGDYDWQMVREGHIQSYGSREEAEQKVLELAEQVCLENGY